MMEIACVCLLVKMKVVFRQFCCKACILPCLIKAFLEKMEIKRFAPGEARTHGLQIMRLTRCLLRYGGLVKALSRTKIIEN